MKFIDNTKHIRVKKMLLGAIKNNRIPHAYLFLGGRHEEMSNAAKDFARLLICESSCGECINCSNLEKEVHPDFITIEPIGTFIKIEQIRDLRNIIKYGPSNAKYLIVRICAADQMNGAASNSLLKTLEEPPDKTIFILIAQREDALPKTIISRCQKIIFSNTEDIETLVQPFSGNKISDALNYARQIAESDDIENKLYSLAAYYASSKDVPDRYKKSQIVLDSAKAVKKHANVRLAVDVMALSLAGFIKK